MNPELPEEAVQFGAAAKKAFSDLGDVDFARKAEIDPSLRHEVTEVMVQLGLDQLDPRTDLISLSAAAACCAEAGRVALPYPVAASLIRDSYGRPTTSVPDNRPVADHSDLFDEWRIADLDGGQMRIARNASQRTGGRLGPFVGLLEELRREDFDHKDILCHQLLTAWSILGTLERAVSDTRFHVNNRIQFGKPIATFQAVQFQLADAAVAVAGLRELACFTLWRFSEEGEGARADVIALRLHAIEAARSVLRICQQLHGAAGVCDEYDISILVRMVQPALRLPTGVEQTAAMLADVIESDGFVGLFEHGGAR